MEEKISYYVFENELNRLEVHNKRWFIVTIILIAVIILTNGAWIYHESLYVDEIKVEQAVDSDGNGNVSVHGIGDYYGNESETNDN